MTSSRPYLIRGLYDWINDNYKTPYIMVNADYLGVSVPKEFVDKGKIILNISPDAVHKLLMSNEEIEFHARFSGISRHVYIPIPAVMAIYAQENVGAGMVFGEEPGGDTPDTPTPETSSNVKSDKKPPKLKLVK
jgi:stringent starvation protein B